jgi:hypothetical protein
VLVSSDNFLGRVGVFFRDLEVFVLIFILYSSFYIDLRSSCADI